jgi:hypothetical protein
MQVEYADHEADAPASAPTDVAPEVEPITTLVPVEHRAIIALNSTKTEVELLAIVTKHKTITEIKNKAGREQAHGAAMELMRARTSIKKVADEARDDAKKFNAAVLAEEKRLTALVEPEETRIKKLRDDWDAAEVVRKEAEAAKERARLLVISEKIAGVRAYGKLASDCRTAARVQALLDKLTAEWAALPLEDTFQEFITEAQAAFDATSASITTLLAAKTAAEAEQARIKAEQEATAARIAAEAAAVAAAAQKLADDRAALDAEMAAFRAQQAAAAPAPVVIGMDFAAGPDASDVVDAEVTAQDLADFAMATAAMVTGAPAPEPAPAAQRPTYFGRARSAAPAPVAQAPEPVAPMLEPELQVRPTDEALISTLAQAYGVSEATAIEWLLELDIDAAVNRLEGATA